MALAALVVLASWVGPAAQVRSHPEGDFYPTYWQEWNNPLAQDSGAVDVFFQGPLGNWFGESGDARRADVSYGFQTWNALGRLVFVESTDYVGEQSTLEWGQCDTSLFYQVNVFWTAYSTDPDELGEVSWCDFHVGEPKRYLYMVTMRFNANGNWSGPVGEHYDLRGLAVHEFGHATGWTGHFSESDATADCPGAEAATMCPIQYQGPSVFAWSTLSTHDMHTFYDLYDVEVAPWGEP